VKPKAGQTGTLLTTTNYFYDVLNRLTKKSYLDPTGDSYLFGYDGVALSGCPGPSVPVISSPTYLIGRRSAMCSGFSSSSWSYDKMGRPIIEARYNKGTTAVQYNVDYSYNLDGSLKTLTYPSGDVVTYTVGGAGRATQLTDSSTNYVGNTGGTGNYATYAPNGALASMTNGYTASPVFAGIVTSNVYNDRLQPILLSAVSSSVVFSLCYDFHLGIAISSGGCSIGAYTTGDNGDVFGILNNVDTTRSAKFAYDPLNRIAQANTVNTTSSNCWGEVYTIDAWGNLTNRAGVSGMTGCATEALNAAPATAQNQLPGLTYDAAGNVTNDGNGNTPTYNDENWMATDAGVTYYYDADGVRMEKTSGTMYWPGPSGEYLTETGLTGTINEEYIYFDGERIARVDRPSGTVHYYFSNHLGSASVVTNATGGSPDQTDYYPFGGVAYSNGSDPNHYKFTGKERDTESNLDSFGARCFASATGRFMTPDWAARPTTVPYAVFGDPQSLNLYTYVRNDPVTRADADGHCDGTYGDGVCSTNPGNRLGNGDQDANRQAGAEAKKGQKPCPVDACVTAPMPRGPDPVAVEMNMRIFVVKRAQAAGLAAWRSPVVRNLLINLILAFITRGEAGEVGGVEGEEGEASDAQSGPGTAKDRSPQGTEDHLKDMEREQKDYRSGKRERPVDSIEKSKQNFKKSVRDNPSLKDWEQ
jgi:RHS repeat-associated protein